ncbi:Glycoside hydrolase, 38 vacuolar alpha mannosidase [Podila humilis]|nr:Glycoside hydrolase, 38 vacuolar alpha mannosidase [Podila humilis]
MATLSAQPRFLRSITLSRAEKFLQADLHPGINLHSRLYKKKAADTAQLSVYSVPDLKRIPFEEAIAHGFEKTAVNSVYSPSWSTHWFKLNVTIPAEWAGEQVELLWDSNSEAMIWSTEGIPRQGLTGGRGDDRRVEYTLARKAKGGEMIELYIEMACNGMFGVGKDDNINPPDENRTFTLTQVEIAVPNKAVWQLYYDMQTIAGMASEIPNESARGQEALWTCNQIIDHFERHNLEESLQKCLTIADEFLKKTGPAFGHRITAVGNWPYAETRRKTARSWSTQLRLMEDYPEYVFVCSQAQQLEWLLEDYPKLFKQLQDAAKRGQFQPIGGSWVENDCNLPSGESLCRQYLYGQRFMEKHFGARCAVSWLPDTFGYSAQMPQIMKQAGCEYFFTQKLSWNNINKFPNTTFNWVGIDGTRILTHMAPCETYNAQADVADLVRSIKNNHDLAFSNQSLMPYGNGDGGGGPQKAMLERIRRMKDTDGLPKCEMGGVETFFESVVESAHDLQEWKGELYLEFHRGTYTTQAATKKYNRKLEILLREVELVSTLCLGLGRDFNYPKKDLDSLWKDVLLNQFHDVLPGSAIEMANKDAREIYRKVELKGRELLDQALDSLHGGSSQSEVAPASYTILNTLQWPRTEVIEVPSVEGFKCLQYSPDKNTGYVKVDQGGFELVTVPQTKLTTSDKTVSVFSRENKFVLQNEWIAAEFNGEGQLVSLFDRQEARELIPPDQLGNNLQLYDDVPLYWLNWDVEVYHLNTGRKAGTGKARIGEIGPLRATIVVDHKLSETSTATQTIVLTSASPRLDFHMKADWDEVQTLLKVEFVWDIQADYATYETQFGLLQRPTTYNTSLDSAKFEVCGHKYADLSEHGYGIALLNDCKYGHSCHGNAMRLSLLRAGKAPDANSDIGHHEFSYAILSHKGTFHEARVVQEAYQFNIPPIVRPSSGIAINDVYGTSFFSLQGTKNAVLDTVKRAEDSDDVIIRIYEAFGGHATFRLKSSMSIASIHRCNVLEDTGDKVGYDQVAKSSELLTLRAFEIITLKLKLK